MGEGACMRYIYEMLPKIKIDLDALESPFAEIIPLPARTLRCEELDLWGQPLKLTSSF
jgi:hypothetical protein